MDPNETLRITRDEIKKASNARTTEEYSDHASAAMDAMEALDEWLSKGGFLPEPWKRKERGQ